MKRIAAWLSQFDWGALIGTALAFIFYIGVISPIISHSVATAAKQQYEQTYSAAEQATIQKYIASESFWERTWHDPMAFYTFVAAIFTGVLSVFTVGLWYVTLRTLHHARRDSYRQWRQTKVGNQAAIRAANAAIKSADAAVAVEMPMVFLSEFTLLESRNRFGPDIQIPIIVAVPEFFRPKFGFTNYGRSIAQVVDIAWGRRIIRDLPEGEVPEFGEWVPTGTIIDRNGGTFSYTDTMNIHLMPQDRERLTSGESRLWVFGRVAYRDFLGNPHERWFCGAWWGPDPGTTSDRPAGFAEGGPESYHRGT